MIKLKNLAIDLAEFNTKDISLTVETGECHVIIGPTGSGKTLILEAIVGFRDLAKGQILLDQQDITEFPVEKRGISYLPQDLAIFPHMTVKENILYGLKINKITDQQKYDFAIELATRLGIKPLFDRRAINLSGGEEQRIALVRALAVENEFLLLDEPFSALHEGLKKELWLILKQLQKEYQFTTLMVTHDLEEAFFLADQLSVMIEGNILQTGDKKEIYQYPKSIEVSNFFGINNLFQGEVVSASEKELKIYATQFATELIIANNSHNLKAGDNITWGIRAEEVMILKAKKYKRSWGNLVEARVVNLFEKGAFNTVLAEIEKTGQKIEIELPNHAFDKLKINRGKEILISIKGASIFTVK